MGENDWNTWSKHVLKELERLNDCYVELNKGIQSVREDIVGLKIKSGMWGLVAGAIPVLVLILIKYLD